MTPWGFLYRAGRKFNHLIINKIDKIIAVMILKGNGVQTGPGFKSNGTPKINVWPKGKMSVGSNFRINNGSNYNIIGRQQPCSMVVYNGAELIIGNHVGMSSTAIVCSARVVIGDYVKIGGNTVIYDTDFHSLDAQLRSNPATDKQNTIKLPVVIGNHVFIGSHSTILKGVTIGNNSIIGACSVVTKNVPENEIWAGNPAKFIKQVASVPVSDNHL